MEANNGRRKPSEEKVWEKFYPTKVDDTFLPKKTMFNYLRDANMDNLNKIAINYDGCGTTFGQLFQRTESVAASFQAIGVKPDELITFVAIATPECVECIYALNILGASVNLIDPRFDVPHITKMLKDSVSRKLVFLDAVYPKVESIIKEGLVDVTVVLRVAYGFPKLKRMIIDKKIKQPIPFSDNVLDWDAFLEKGKGVKLESAPYEGDRTAVITYTGGTTGFPKGVMLTNDSINSVAESLRIWKLPADNQQKFLAIIPIFTSYGIVSGFHAPLCDGVQMIIPFNFKPDKLGHIFKKFRPNNMGGTPALYEKLIESKELKNMDLSFINVLGCGGDTVNEGLENRFNEFFEAHNVKFKMAQGYGMSELSSAISLQVKGIHKQGSCGIPCPLINIAIIDIDTKQEVGYGQVGELCATGPQMMKGYFENQAETDNIIRIHEDGKRWVHSGDLAYMDEDGFIYIVGRIKRMIVRFDGHKVYPINLESQFNCVPGVRTCLVIQIKDLDHSQGFLPLAVVELAKKAKKDEVDKKLRELCLTDVEERGRPADIVYVEKMPMTGSAKSDYKTLEKQFENYEYRKQS